MQNLRVSTVVAHDKSKRLVITSEEGEVVLMSYDFLSQIIINYFKIASEEIENEASEAPVPGVEPEVVVEELLKRISARGNQ